MTSFRTSSTHPNTPTRSTIVGIFEDRRRAEEAVGELERVGFGPDQIGFAVRDRSYETGSHSRHSDTDLTTDTGPGSGTATGATAGGVLGGIIGAAAALAVPGVGPALAAGILGPVLASAAAGAGIGAASGGLMGGLVTTGISEEDARYYDSEFRSGRAIVTVKAGPRADEAQRILRDFGAYDVDTRGASLGPANPTGNQVRTPEIEERLDVQKREVQQGEVRLHKRVETEQQSIPVDVMREEVHVEQREVSPRPLAEHDTIRAFEEGTIRIPIRGEEVIVRKEAVVTGEVVIEKERTVERQEITDTVRKQHVEVDRDYERHRSDFRSHFDTLRASDAWDDSESNYRYGWAAGRASRYAGRSFEDVEGDLRSSYYADAEDAKWQRLREQVREGFRRARAY